MAAQNESFSQSKKDLERIYADHAITFYCGCKYDKRKKGNMIDRSSCGYVPRNPTTKAGKVNPRTTRIEWEHVVPAENFGRQFTCWRDGAPECVDSKGKAFKGRKCCEKASQQFRIMQADMHNLVPAIGELNGDRSNLRYDFEEARKGQYGECRFEVDFDQDRVRAGGDQERRGGGRGGDARRAGRARLDLPPGDEGRGPGPRLASDHGDLQAHALGGRRKTEKGAAEAAPRARPARNRPRTRRRPCRPCRRRPSAPSLPSPRGSRRREPRW